MAQFILPTKKTTSPTEVQFDPSMKPSSIRQINGEIEEKKREMILCNSNYLMVNVQFISKILKEFL